MKRREFNQLLFGAAMATTIPQLAHSRSAKGSKTEFLAALEDKPWLHGYLGSQDPLLQSDLHIEYGRVPDGLRGDFFRNGPARHIIGEDRFAHWFDAPGMIQRFAIGDAGVSHLGRWSDTARSQAETAANKILYNGFGTAGIDLSSGGSADAQNPANISLLHHGGELLALWEGGSPHIIDPDTLETLERKHWSSESAGLPFGAHPRRDTDGSVWNIGYSANPAAIVIYHLSPEGSLQQMHVLPQTHTPMLHDFLITETKLVLVMPPFRASQTGDGAFLDQFEWNDREATEIWVIDKSDLTNVTHLQTEAFWVFHFGNAYDISSSEIGFDFSLHADPGWMTTDGFQIMDGTWNGGSGTPMHYAQARLDLVRRSVHIEIDNGHGQVEFVQADPRQTLTQHRHALMLSHSDGAGHLGWNKLVLIDRMSGKSQSYQPGSTELLEEHLIVPKPENADDFWIIGTSLDWQNTKTALSVYEGWALEDGPVLKATLDYPLPLGLHGLFLPA